MAYTIEAFIGREEALRTLGARFSGVLIVPVAQGFGVVAFGPALRASMESSAVVSDPAASWPFRLLASEGAHQAQLASVGHRIANIEAEYFGGTGEQAAIVWDNGSILSPPTLAKHAINRALESLGVASDTGKDAFDTLGLGGRRSTNDWLDSGR